MIQQDELERAIQSLHPIERVDVARIDSFILQYSRMIDRFQEYVTTCHVDMQRYSGDETTRRRNEEAQTRILPLLNELRMHLARITLASTDDESHLARVMRNRLDLYDERLTDLQIEEARLVQRYVQVTVGLCDPEDETRALAELQGDLYDEDETVRKRAFLRMSEAYASKQAVITTCLTALVENRQEQARRLQLETFNQLAFKRLGRLDYDTSDCRRFAEAVRVQFAPLHQLFAQKQMTRLNKPARAPWDRYVSPFQLDETPSVSNEVLIDGTAAVLARLDPDFERLFRAIEHAGNLDLTPRPNKADGGFCEPFPETKSSFIFMNGYGGFDDVVVLLHEMGHAIHHDYSYRHSHPEARIISFEVGEFAAMTLELLTMEGWEELFPSHVTFLHAKFEQFRLALQFLPDVFLVDRFQQTIYEAGASTFDATYDELAQRFEGESIHWGDTESLRAQQWMQVIHLFETPFYYIEYALAQVAALRMYMAYQHDPKTTLARFKRALALGNTVSVDEVYRTAGVSLFPTGQELVELTAWLQDEVTSLVRQLDLELVHVDGEDKPEEEYRKQEIANQNSEKRQDGRSD